MAVLQHERWKCIGCSACVAIAPDHWDMADDGKTDIKGSTSKDVPEGKLQEKPLSEAELPQNKEAAEVCPVNCIHVFLNGKKLV